MKTLFKLILIVFSLPVLAESIDFDVTGGKFIYLYKGGIESNGGISCDISASANANDGQWQPSILIGLLSDEDPNVTQVSYAPTNGFHSFGINVIDSNDSYSYASEFLALKRETPSVRLSMFWREDGVIIYKAGDMSAQGGEGFVHNKFQKFDLLQVTASGVKGTINCFPDNI